MDILRATLLWGSQNKWLEHQFRQRSFAKKAISRFMPGEDVMSALEEAKTLSSRNITTVVSCLGENVASLDEAERVATHYDKVLQQIHALGLDTHISLKPTHLGLELDRGATNGHLSTLAARAAEYGNFMWVDMEASNCVDDTLAVFGSVKARHGNVGICVQSYLRRTAHDLPKLLEMNAPIRLVKGAYKEPPSVAFRRKRDADENFFTLAQMLLEHTKGYTGQPHGIATHDINLISRIQTAAQEMGLARDQFEVQMLYGIRRADQDRLAKAGVPVRVLISYGEAWFPWYMRRLAERPANIGFVFRSMVTR
jgi:proline dehydrogenase